jgi:hypothetical protein
MRNGRLARAEVAARRRARVASSARHAPSPRSRAWLEEVPSSLGCLGKPSLQLPRRPRCPPGYEVGRAQFLHDDGQRPGRGPQAP